MRIGPCLQGRILCHHTQVVLTAVICLRTPERLFAVNFFNSKDRISFREESILRSLSKAILPVILDECLSFRLLFSRYMETHLIASSLVHLANALLHSIMALVAPSTTGFSMRHSGFWPLCIQSRLSPLMYRKRL